MNIDSITTNSAGDVSLTALKTDIDSLDASVTSLNADIVTINSDIAVLPTTTYVDNVLALKIPLTYIDTDPALTADSDSKLPSQKAVKAYIDSNVENTLEIVNVKDYGAKGDGTTDDTAAFNAAIAVADNYIPGLLNGTLYIPSGVYKLNPTTLKPFNCHVYGPQATLQANTNAADTLVKIGATPWLNIQLSAVSAYDTTAGGTRYGYGLGIDVTAAAGSYPGNAFIKIDSICGFKYGISFWNGNGQHIGTMKIDVRVIYTCEVGIYLIDADTALQVENNVINVTYMVDCDTFVQMLGITGGACQGNVITIDSLELWYGTNMNGISLVGQYVQHNIIRVNTIFWDDANTTYIYNSISGAKNNVVELPDIDLTKVNIANDILKISTNGFGNMLADCRGRSVVYGASPAPVTGTWRIGDRYIINNPTSGQPGQYVYTSGGWKAETTVA